MAITNTKKYISFRNILIAAVFLSVAAALGSSLFVSSSAATSQQARQACSKYDQAIKKASKQKIDVKQEKKTYTQICKTSTVKTPAMLTKDVNKMNNQIKSINRKVENKKKSTAAGTGISKCGDVDTAFNYGCAGADSGSGDNKNPIFQVLFFIVNILAVGVGMAAIGGVIYGAILYTSAGDNGEQTKKGINIVVNAVLGVILFAFMYAILNFLVPGGLFTG